MTPRPRRRMVARLAGTVARLPRYLNLAQRLLREPTLSPARKAAVGFGIGYVALPLDLVPGIIPVLGQLDDLAALLLGLRVALHGCTPDCAQEHLTAAGLSPAALDADIRTVQVTMVWVVARTANFAGGVVQKTVRALGRLRTTTQS